MTPSACRAELADARAISILVDAQQALLDDFEHPGAGPEERALAGAAHDHITEALEKVRALAFTLGSRMSARIAAEAAETAAEEAVWAERGLAA